MLNTFSIDHIREYIEIKLDSKAVSGSTKFRVEKIKEEMKKLQMYFPRQRAIPFVNPKNQETRRRPRRRRLRHDPLRPLQRDSTGPYNKSKKLVDVLVVGANSDKSVYHAKGYSPELANRQNVSDHDQQRAGQAAARVQVGRSRHQGSTLFCGYRLAGQAQNRRHFTRR